MTKIILDWYHEGTKAEIAIDSSYKDNMKIGDLIKFLMQMRKICNDAKDNKYSSGHNYQALPNINFDKQQLSNKF